MSTPDLILFITILLAGFYMAWNIGANDVANAMGTSVGSGALSLKNAVLLAAIFEFSGALLFGSHVSETVQSGIVSPSLFAGDLTLYVHGMLSALLAAGAWLQIASFFGWPVSTTQSIIGAIIGFGVIVGGIEAVEWSQVVSIVVSWVLSPVLGGIISYFIFSFLRNRIFYASRPLNAAIKIAPFFAFLLTLTMSLTLISSCLDSLGRHVGVQEIMLTAFILALLAAFLTKAWMKTPKTMENNEITYQPELVMAFAKVKKHLSRIRIHSEGEVAKKVDTMLCEIDRLTHSLSGGSFKEVIHRQHQSVEKIFAYFQVLSACMMAFAHGANDVANAIGPLAGSLNVLLTGRIVQEGHTPQWALVLGGVGIVVGLATWGWRVIETVGRKITELTPTRGFSAELGAALTVLVATRLGLPISATHTLVGAVLGVGMARGIGAINLLITRDILVSWVVTLPAGAVLSTFFFSLINLIFA